MDSFVSFLFVFSLLLSVHASGADDVPFQQNYSPSWGYDHIKVLDRSREIQLTLDQHSGSGFQSWQKYGSGWFNLRIKMPQKDSTGVITTFYLQSDVQRYRDEIDFEFLGGNGRERRHLLQTNIYTNGQGGREERIFLWFDPTADFHDYTLLWNQQQLVFFVDEIPIRVFKNTTRYGGAYPTQAMKIITSIWTDTWASHGIPVNWNDAPFEAHYRGFDITACSTSNNNNDQHCQSSSKFWWNQKQHWSLNSTQQEAYENVRSKYMSFDYCTVTHYPECQYNQ